MERQRLSQTEPKRKAKKDCPSRSARSLMFCPLNVLNSLLDINAKTGIKDSKDTTACHSWSWLGTRPLSQLAQNWQAMPLRLDHSAGVGAADRLVATAVPANDHHRSISMYYMNLHDSNRHWMKMDEIDSVSLTDLTVQVAAPAFLASDPGKGG